MHDEIHITSLFVTHDQEEALEVADRVVVMNQGRIEQIGSPDEVYNHPATPFVYKFLGNVNLFHGRIDEGQAHLLDHAVSTTKASPNSQDTVVYVRPHFLEIRREPDGAAHFRATIRHINSAGPLVKIEARTEWGGSVHVELSQERFRELQLAKNDEVFIIPKEVKVFRDSA